jgi:hypothetical protein
MSEEVPRESLPPAPTVFSKISSKNPYTRQGNDIGNVSPVIRGLKARSIKALSGNPACHIPGFQPS